MVAALVLGALGAFACGSGWTLFMIVPLLLAGRPAHAAPAAVYSLPRVGNSGAADRHCPKCQGAAAREWLEEREDELLPAPYFHVVYTLPGPIADIAYQNKAVIYDILFKASAETMITIAADPKHLGARIGITSVLHTWGSAMTHHPHVHMIVPGGGISLDGQRWVSCRPNFFLAVRVLSRLFRRLVLQMLIVAHETGRLQFSGAHAALATRSPPSSSRSGDRNGWSIRRSHSADPKRFSRTSRATRIASPSLIAA